MFLTKGALQRGTSSFSGLASEETKLTRSCSNAKGHLLTLEIHEVVIYMYIMRKSKLSKMKTNKVSKLQER